MNGPWCIMTPLTIVQTTALAFPLALFALSYASSLTKSNASISDHINQFPQPLIDNGFHNLSLDLHREMIAGNPSLVWLFAAVCTFQGAQHVIVLHAPAGC